MKRKLYCGNIEVYNVKNINYNYLYKRSFTFIKLDEQTRQGIEGAIFELRNRNILLATSISDNYGRVQFNNIRIGNYQLYETVTPIGYQENKTIYNVQVMKDRVLINNIDSIQFILENIRLNLNDYVIRYDPNGMEGNIAFDIEQERESIYTVIDNIFNSENEFVEWNTANNGIGITYNPGESFLLDRDKTLYAIWKSRIPIFDSIYQNNKVISGKGIAGSHIITTLPDGMNIDTVVSNKGIWTIDIPNEFLPLIPGDIIKAKQIESNMVESNYTESIVIASTIS